MGYVSTSSDEKAFSNQNPGQTLSHVPVSVSACPPGRKALRLDDEVCSCWRLENDPYIIPQQQSLLLSIGITNPTFS